MSWTDVLWQPSRCTWHAWPVTCCDTKWLQSCWFATMSCVCSLRHLSRHKSQLEVALNATPKLDCAWHCIDRILATLSGSKLLNLHENKFSCSYLVNTAGIMSSHSMDIDVMIESLKQREIPTELQVTSTLEMFPMILSMFRDYII